jgi:hypothetical protein
VASERRDWKSRYSQEIHNNNSYCSLWGDSTTRSFTAPWYEEMNKMLHFSTDFTKPVSLKVGCLHPVASTRSGSGFPSNATLFLNMLLNNRYMFRLYDHLQAEIYFCMLYAWLAFIIFKLVVCILFACTRSGSGFPSNATLVWIFYSVTATCFGLMAIYKPEDGHKTETCSSYWIKYSNQCCFRRKPWTWYTPCLTIVQPAYSKPVFSAFSSKHILLSE